MQTWLPYALITTVFWALWNFFSKFAQGSLSPKQFVVYETIGFMLTTTVLLVLGIWQFQPSSKGALFGILTGAAGALGSMFFFMSIGKGPVSLVVPVTSLYPVFVLVLAFFFFGEVLTIKQGAGMACALLAIVLLST